MGRGVDIPWIGCQNIMGMGVDIPSVGSQNTMDRGVDISNLPYRGGSVFNKGFNIPCMKVDPGVNLPWGSKYHMTPGHNIFFFRDRLLYRWPH
jgi:hypothetical protein